MANFKTTKNLVIGTLLSLGALTGTQAYAAIQEVEASKPLAKLISQDNKKKSWALAFDNDVLVPGSRDQDYTYGINLTFSGDHTKDHLASTHRPLSWIDGQLGINQNQDSYVSHQIEYGLFGFTPEDIVQAEPNQNDRPYASLIYVSSSNEYYNPESESSWNSTLTIGVLGLNVVGELQSAVHELTDGDQPAGWDNQISQGGELTARYTLSRQQLLLKTRSGAEIKSTLQGSVGYITEASWSIGGRIGKIHTPWVSFNPELTSYGEKSAPTNSSRLYESYFWGGIAIKARAYNAFLQGQFRDSEVELGENDVNHAILEGWVGYTLALKTGYRFTYSLRGHTSEIKEGLGDRNVIWGGVQLAKTFG